MNDHTVFKGYAEAFLSYTKGLGVQEQAAYEIIFIRKIIEKDHDLIVFLRSMEIGGAEKADLLLKSFAGLSEPTAGFLKLLIERRRIGHLLEICLAIENAYKNRIESECRIRSSFSLEEGYVTMIKAKLEKKLKRKLRVVVEVDKSLIAGIQAIVDNVIIDGTLKHRIDELREKLLAVRVV